MLDEFLGLFETFGGIAAKTASQQRLLQHALGCVVGFGRKTLSAILCTIGQQHRDWCAHYRLYSKKRVDIEASFQNLLHTTVGKIGDGKPVTGAMDDTLVRKSGKKIPGVGLMRDPLSPPYRANFVCGQRLTQISVSLCEPDGGVSRMIPVLMRDSPVAKKPHVKAPKEKWDEYRKLKKERNLSMYGVACLKQVRQWLDSAGEAARMFICSVDGSYTNKTVLRRLPHRTTIVGRVRKDAKLFYPPQAQEEKTKRGAKRVYGKRAPTPEELLNDEAVSFQPIHITCNGRQHTLRVKHINNLRWAASGKKDVHLIVIAPLGYRLCKHGRINFRKPVYLICTDPKMGIKEIIAAFLKRWDIEVNFRDEKTLIGAGQAQVRNPQSVKALPQMAVLAYATLLLAGINAFGVGGKPSSIQPPKWYQSQHENQTRASTNDLIAQLRYELWSKAIIPDKLTGFAVSKHDTTKPEKLHLPLNSAAFCANG